MVSETLMDYMIDDMKEPLSYLPEAAWIGAVVLAIYCCVNAIRLIISKRDKKNHNIRVMGFREIIWFFMSVYIVVFLKVSFFSRYPGSRDTVNMELFGTWGNSEHSHAYLIENIIFFIPLGVFLPILYEQFRKIWLCIPFGAIVSILLEIVQHITKRGYLQLDDILTNIVGTFLGWCLVMPFILAFDLVRNKKQKRLVSRLTHF